MKFFKFLLPLPFIIIFFSCMNPLTPSLNELRGDRNYFPFDNYIKWELKSDQGDTYVFTVEDAYVQNGEIVYHVTEEFGSGKYNYYFIIGTDGIYYTLAGINTVYIKYPLILNFYWEFKTMLNVIKATVTEEGEIIQGYESSKKIKWDIYTFDGGYAGSYYYVLEEGLGPVFVEREGKKYYLESYEEN